jgi:molybdopterin synthase catalytic subunit
MTATADVIRSRIVTRPLDIAALVAEVADSACGATAVFVGTVRDMNDGRAVTGMEYTAYAEMAEREIASIAAEAARRFAPLRLSIEHRIGELAVGEASVAIAAAHAHRAPAIDGMRYVIEELKRRVPIWKREHYVDGTREWVGAPGAGAGQ